MPNWLSKGSLLGQVLHQFGPFPKPAPICILSAQFSAAICIQIWRKSAPICINSAPVQNRRRFASFRRDFRRRFASIRSTESISSCSSTLLFVSKSILGLSSCSGRVVRCQVLCVEGEVTTGGTRVLQSNLYDALCTSLSSSFPLLSVVSSFLMIFACVSICWIGLVG